MEGKSPVKKNEFPIKSAKEIQIQLGVTYKCTWRITHQIRKLMGEKSSTKLSGCIEIDDTYIGGKTKGKRGRGAEKKTAVLGMIERKGNVKGHVVSDMKKKTVVPIIKDNILIGATVNTDEFRSYRSLRKEGYLHSFVNHGLEEYVNGDIHV